MKQGNLPAPLQHCIGAAFAVGDYLSRQLKEALESRSARLIEFADPLIEVDDVWPAMGLALGPLANLATLRTNMSSIESAHDPSSHD